MGKLKYFPMYFSYSEKLAILTDDQLGRVVRAIMKYMDKGESTELEPIEILAFQMIKTDAELSSKKYEETCQERKKAAEKRWADQNSMQMHANASTSIQEDANDAKVKGKRTKDKGKASSYEDAVEAAARKAPPVDESPVVIALILNDGSEYPLTENMAAEYERLYPAVDVRQAFRNMAGWCMGNPGKRKTKAGVGRFINAWLSREQDRFHPAAQPAPAYRPPAQDNGMMDFLNSVIAGEDTYDTTGNGGDTQDTQDSVSGLLF